MSESFFGRAYYWPDIDGVFTGTSVEGRAQALQRMIKIYGPSGRDLAHNLWPRHPRAIAILALELSVYSASKGEALPPVLVDVLAWCMKLPEDYRTNYLALRSAPPTLGRPPALENATFKLLMIDLRRKMETGEVWSTRQMQAELKREYGATVSRSHIDVIRADPAYAEAVQSVGFNSNI